MSGEDKDGVGGLNVHQKTGGSTRHKPTRTNGLQTDGRIWGWGNMENLIVSFLCVRPGGWMAWSRLIHNVSVVAKRLNTLEGLLEVEW